MTSTDKKRVWVSSIIGIIVVLILLWLIPAQKIQARGILLPSNTSRPSISENKVIFYSNPPNSYQTLGSLRIARHYSAGGTKQAEREILNLAKKLAAKAGANGVIVKLFAHSVPGVVPAAQAVYAFRATAVYSNDIAINQLSLPRAFNEF